DLAERVRGDVRKLCTALGYDINTVEFAIKDGIPYAIDFMNPAPDADLHSVGEFYHNWVTNSVTDLVFKRLASANAGSTYRWDAFLNSGSTMGTLNAIVPDAVKEIGSDILVGASQLIEETKAAFSGILEEIPQKEAKES